MIERCKRICGGVSDCCITNSKQAACISDMVINKVSGIKLLIEELALAESGRDELKEKLAIALKNIDELTNWVKFLQIVHDLRLLGSLSPADNPSEKRKESRYPLPAAYQNYLRLKIHAGASWTPAHLLNFSRYGMQFRYACPLDLNEVHQCVLSTARSFRNAVSFKARVSNCRRQNEEFIIGATIEEVEDSGIFNFFESAYNLVMEICRDLAKQEHQPLPGVGHDKGLV